MRGVSDAGLHHLPLIVAGLAVSIDFWSGLLGMPLILEQPNHDTPAQARLNFGPGNGRLITIFANEDRERNDARTCTEICAVQHFAVPVSAELFALLEALLELRGIFPSGHRQSGLTDATYPEDRLGMLTEMACYGFAEPDGCAVADVMIAAQRVRLADGARSMEEARVAVGVG